MGKRKFNGEGTFYYSEKLQRWIGQFTDQNTGKRKSVSDVDEKKAKAKLRKAMADSENGKYADRNNITLSELGREILDLKLEANIICENTYHRCDSDLALISKGIGQIRVQKVTKAQIQDFLNSLKDDYSNSIIGKVYQLLNLIFKEAILRGILVKNPIDYVIKPKSIKKDKKVRALTIEEHQQFIVSLDKHQYRNIFLLAINTGMRAGEILALQLENIDFKNKVIKVRKTLSRNKKGQPILKEVPKTYAGNRDIPFDNKIEKVLKDSIANMTINPKKLLFTHSGKLIATSSLNGAFLTICRNLEFKVKDGNITLSLHSLRHTFATRCIEAGMPAHVLQKLLGHTDISVTINTYTDILDKYKEDEMIKVNNYMIANNLSI